MAAKRDNRRFRLEYRGERPHRSWRVYVDVAGVTAPTAVLSVADLRSSLPALVGHPAYPFLLDLLHATRDAIELRPYERWDPESPDGWVWAQHRGDACD